MQVETNRKIKIPVSVKAPLIFIGLFAFFAVMYIAKGIIIPIVFATIIAIILHPDVNLFVRIILISFNF